MKKFFKKYFWTLLIVLAALGLAGSAAYFSITGLSKLFAGSAMQVIIMASFIEFGKLVTTAALHRYWKKTKWWMKYTLTTMVLAVMLITSMGIYGFLADAYATTSVELQKIEGQITLVEKQQEQKRIQITGIEEIKTSKSNRMTSLIELRSQQEVRLDSLLANHHWTNARRTQEQIDAASAEIIGLQTNIDSLITRINGVNEEIGVMDISILDLQSSDIATEIGPLKYMSTVLDRPMENIINYFILILIFVFDPLAVLLIIFASNVYDANNEINGPPEEKKKGVLSRLRERFKKPEPEPEVENKTPEPLGELNYIDYEFPNEPVEVDDEPVIEEEVVNHPPVVDDEVDDAEPEEGNQQKIVDVINSVDEDSGIFDFDHDFPEEKGEEVIDYVEGEDGEFEKVYEPKKSLATIIQGIESNPIYLSLLDILFIDGQRKVGDIIPPIKGLIEAIEGKGITYEKRVVDNFLTICNLLSITDMSDKNKVTITMDYNQAKNIISLVSK